MMVGMSSTDTNTSMNEILENVLQVLTKAETSKVMERGEGSAEMDLFPCGGCRDCDRCKAFIVEKITQPVVSPPRPSPSDARLG